MLSPPESNRSLLIDAVRVFVERVRGLRGLHRIALIGSLTTAKPNPKDADVLVWVDEGADLQPLAQASRQLKGQAQSSNSGADIFVVDATGTYLGRICHYRDCRPGVRMSCRALHCGRRQYLCDDLRNLKLRADVVRAPPVELWPAAAAHAPVPEDIQQLVRLAARTAPPSGVPPFPASHGDK